MAGFSCWQVSFVGRESTLPVGFVFFSFSFSFLFELSFDLGFAGFNQGKTEEEKKGSMVGGTTSNDGTAW
ncbi:MAG: hypothetical protein GY820_15765 [Gammaproteobacteria bacterium]|nr:hypothetical protein [Gammaproteobacteria bacterium]